MCALTDRKEISLESPDNFRSNAGLKKYILLFYLVSVTPATCISHNQNCLFPHCSSVRLNGLFLLMIEDCSSSNYWIRDATYRELY